MHKFNSSYTNVRIDLLKFIDGVNLSILDIGCATGENGKYLKNKGIASHVAGVEIDPEMAEEAKKKIDNLVVGDLENLELRGEFAGAEFDYIILGDILEHLINPWKTLASCVEILNKDGQIIISLPNIQHIETFIQIYVKGKWPYNSRGIFDKTHLRFFTYRNMEDLVCHSGLTISELKRVYRFRDSTSEFPKFTKKFFKKCFPNLFTFQYILVCKINSN